VWRRGVRTFVATLISASDYDIKRRGLVESQSSRSQDAARPAEVIKEAARHREEMGWRAEGITTTLATVAARGSKRLDATRGTVLAVAPRERVSSIRHRDQRISAWSPSS